MSSIAGVEVNSTEPFSGLKGTGNYIVAVFSAEVYSECCGTAIYRHEIVDAAAQAQALKQLDQLEFSNTAFGYFKAERKSLARTCRFERI